MQVKKQILPTEGVPHFSLNEEKYISRNQLYHSFLKRDVVVQTKRMFYSIRDETCFSPLM